MAKKFLTPLGLVGLASDPATGSEGQLYFNTTDDVVRVYANGVWTELSGAGGEGASVIYSASQPDVTSLNVGTIWVDSDATISGGGGGGGGGTGLSFWSEDNLGNLIPDSASVQNIGSLQYPVKDIFLSASSIYLGNTKLVSNGSTLIVGSNELLNSSTASTLYATKTELNNINLNSAITTASAAAYSSASAYTNAQIANINLSSAIQTASAAAVTYLVDSAPGALDTLNELAAALNDDANFATTVTNSIAGKLSISAASATYLPLSSSASFYRWTKTYSASASVISGVDDNSISLSYNAGYIQLFINGVMLDPSEYTATSGSAITVSTPVLSGEVVDIFAFLNSTSVNTYSQAQIDNKYNNLTRWKKAYSASATVISGVDDNSNTLSYLSGYEQFYLNGILLTPITDYARTSASVVTLSTALISGDIVEIINTQPFNVADVYNTSQANNTFLTQSSASTTYLTRSSASTTYLTQTTGVTAATASATYTPLSSPVTSYKNKIINSGFDIWQRGTSFSATGYTADRWLLQADGSGATRSITQQTFTPGNPVTGYEPTYYLRYNQSVAGTSATYNLLDQRIEDVRTFAGQIITVSFWAKASSPITLTSQINQAFGSGGSAEVNAVGVNGFDLSSSWQRFSYTGTVASISGKTIGTSSHLVFRFNFPVNTTFTVDIWGVQVEKGSIATEFEQRFIGDELRMCQRYYQKSFPYDTTPANNLNINGNYAKFVATGTNVYNQGSAQFFVPLRANPSTVVFYTYNSSAGKTGNWFTDTVNGGASGSAAAALASANTQNINASINNGNGFNTGNTYGIHWTVDSEL
jgi:hypothetical protein